MDEWMSRGKEGRIDGWLCRCGWGKVPQINLKPWSPLKDNSQKVATDFVIKLKEEEIENSQKRKFVFFSPEEI